MFAGRSAKSLQCFKKTHASSPVLHALLACVFLIVLDIDVTWSMSLDKLALERNEVFESQPDSSVTDIGSAPVLIDDMLLQPIPEQGNTDLFVLLPANHDDGIERNTIDVGAEQGSDMLMMETDDEPAMEIVAAVPAEAITDEEIKQVENEKQSVVQEQDEVNVVETPAEVAFEVIDTPISLLLTDQAQPQIEPVMEQALDKSDDAETMGEQNKMAEIPELNENQQHQDAIKLDAAEVPLGVNIPVDAVEDLGNALETEIAENAESVPVLGTTKLELENVEDTNNNLETENVGEVVQSTVESLNVPAEQQQKVVLEDAPKDNMEYVAEKKPVPSVEEANMEDVLDAVQDVLDSQQAAETESEKELEKRPQVEAVADSVHNEVEENKQPSHNSNEEDAVNIKGKEEQKESLPEVHELEKIEEAAEETLNNQAHKEEAAIQVEQTKYEKPKEEEEKEEEPKEEDPKKDELKEEELKEEKLKEEEPKEKELQEEELKKEEPQKEESLDEAPTEENQRPEPAQEEKIELEKNKEEAKDEDQVQNKPIEIELKGELPKIEEVIDEQEKVEEQLLEEFNEADNMALETQVVEEEKNGEKKQSPVEESPVEQNSEEKTSDEEMEANEHSQEEQVNEQQNIDDQLQQEQNLEIQNIEENEEGQAHGEPVIEAQVQGEHEVEQHIAEEQQEEQHNIEEQKPEEIIKNETMPTIEVVAPTNNDMETLNIVEEAQSSQIQNENLLPEPEAIEQQHHTQNDTPLEQEKHEVDKNEDKNSLEIPEEIVVEEQLMPVDIPAAGAADEMTVNNEEEHQQQETEPQTEELAAAIQHGTEVTDAATEEVQEVAVQTNADETVHIDEDKTQIAHEEEKDKETQNPETNSMLTTIVQVPVQQPQLELLPPVQNELHLDLVPPVQDEVKLEEKDDQPIQTPVDNNAILEAAIQIPQAEQTPAVVAQEQQQQSIQAVIEPATQKPFNVMDSVLNYVNASFTANNINNQNQQQQQQLQDNDDVYSSQLRRYDGAQVWRIVVQNDRDKKLADELQTKYDGQLWKEVKQEVDYLLKPQVLADAAKHIRAANLSRIVLIDNLQNVIEVENPPADEIAHLQNRKGHRLTWQAYHRLEDIHGFFDYLAKTYPDICSVETIGYSVEKRPLKILKISNGNAKNPGIWMDGGMHAREWISPASVTYVANQLVEGWDDLPAKMRNINWYIHAVANPDGYEYTHTTDRLWRKNMRSHGRQCPGVDLNRNFGYKWGGKGTSANPCSQTYRGSKAFSEPETFYISKFISNYPRETFQAYLSFHSYGQYILYPWGYDYQVTKDRADLDRVARQAGTTITKSSGVKYTVGASATTLYPAAGGSDDWAKGIAGIKYSYTIEMGDTGRYGFILPASMIESNAQDAYTFVQTVASAVTNQGKFNRKRAI